jgi:hypothetical protein
LRLPDGVVRVAGARDACEETQMEAVLRIALIHALAHSIAPINDELDRSWPGACG